MNSRLLWLSLVFSVSAAAQVTCSATVPAPTTIRLEGKTDFVGDVVVMCTGGSPTGNGQAIQPVDFTLSFNANVTSRPIGPGNRVEALALLDEPASDGQFACSDPSCTSTGNGEGGGYYGPFNPNLELFGNPNVFEGVVGTGSASNSITFRIPFDPSGSSTRTIRFTNLRLDANPLGVTSMQLVSITAIGQIPITGLGGPLPVGTARTGRHRPECGERRPGAGGSDSRPGAGRSGGGYPRSHRKVFADIQWRHQDAHHWRLPGPEHARSAHGAGDSRRALQHQRIRVLQPTAPDHLVRRLPFPGRPGRLGHAADCDVQQRAG
jgi:hypothetical protein